MLTEVRRRVDVYERHRPENSWPTPARLDAGWFEQLTQASTLSLSDFQKSLQYVLDQVDKPGERVRLVLLLDEMDELIDQPWMENLGNNLRALISSSDMKTRIRLVIAGSRRLFDAVSRGSPFLNVLQKHYLEVLNKPAIQQLARRAEGLSDEVISAVWVQSGGHPFLAQYLLYHLWDARRHTLNVRAVEDLAARFRHEHIDDIEDWATALGEAGLRTYGVLAVAPNWVGEDSIIKAMRDPQINVNETLSILCCHGLVVHEKWQRFKCAGLMFRVWFDMHSRAFLERHSFLETEPTRKDLEASTEEARPPQSSSTHRPLHDEKSKVRSDVPSLYSYTLVALASAVTSSVIFIFLPADRFWPFFILLTVILTFILVLADRLTGGQFLDWVSKLLEKWIPP